MILAFQIGFILTSLAKFPYEDHLNMRDHLTMKGIFHLHIHARATNHKSLGRITDDLCPDKLHVFQILTYQTCWKNSNR